MNSYTTHTLFIKLYFILFTTISHSIMAGAYFDTIDQVKAMYSVYDRHTHLDFLNLEIVKNELKFKDLLRELIRNDDNILDCVGAYYHPAGFIKLVLYNGEKGEQLRFHFWGKGDKKAIHQEFNDGWEPVHNHRWNFSSKVIRGELDMREYMDHNSHVRFDSKDEALFVKHKFNNTYFSYDVVIVPTRLKEEKDDYKIIKTGRVALIGDCIFKKITRGHAYYLDHRVPHQVKPEPDTVTLLLMDPPSKSFASEIFVQPEDRFQDEFKLINLTHEEIQQYLLEFLVNFSK